MASVLVGVLECRQVLLVLLVVFFVVFVVLVLNNGLDLVKCVGMESDIVNLRRVGDCGILLNKLEAHDES
jgi:hypothetical protein